MDYGSILRQNQRMNGWFWQYDVLRVLLSSLGYQNERIAHSANWYKGAHQHHRHGKPLSEIIRMENHGIYPIVFNIEKEFPHVELGQISKLSESGNLHYALSRTMAAFVMVKAGKNDHGWKDRVIPVTDLRSDRRTLQNFYINFENPPPEILQSIVGKPRERFGAMWPSRILFNLDVEFHTRDPMAMDNEVGLYYRLEPARRIIEQELAHYGIPHTCIMTGRGYHFVSQVMGSSPFMEELVKMGWNLEYGVRARADSNDLSDHVGFRMPHSAERAYKGITRLQQFVFNKVIKRIRRATHLPVEISDRGSYCIVLDNTSMLRTSHTGNVAVVASPYEKFYERGGRIMARLNRSHNDCEWIQIKDAHHIRRYMDSSLNFLKAAVGYIPEASEGLWNLAQDYWKSDLFHKLHNRMDHAEHEAPWNWGHTYRKDDYAALRPVVGNIWDYAHSMRELNTNLLNPDIINGFIFGLDRAGWHPKHIAGALRSIYEDGRFHWNDFFHTNCAERHANGWTEIILGQKYEWP